MNSEPMPSIFCVQSMKPMLNTTTATSSSAVLVNISPSRAKGHRSKYTRKKKADFICVLVKCDLLSLQTILTSSKKITRFSLDRFWNFNFSIMEGLENSLKGMVMSSQAALVKTEYFFLLTLTRISCPAACPFIQNCKELNPFVEISKDGLRNRPPHRL